MRPMRLRRSGVISAVVVPGGGAGRRSAARGGGCRRPLRCGRGRCRSERGARGCRSRLVLLVVLVGRGLTAFQEAFGRREIELREKLSESYGRARLRVREKLL